MRQFVALAVLIACAIVIPFALPAQAKDWDETTQFSLENNPNGDWSYGYLEEDGTFGLYNSTFDVEGGLQGWALYDDPDMAGNIVTTTSAEPVDKFGASWEPGKVYLQPGSGERKPAVRWTAPFGATIRINGKFTARAYLTKVRVDVLKNGTIQINSGLVEGFIGSVSSRKSRSGPSPERSCAASIRVEKSDTIDFVVDAGGVLGPNQVGADISITVVNQDLYGFAPSTDPESYGWMGVSWTPMPGTQLLTSPFQLLPEKA